MEIPEYLSVPPEALGCGGPVAVRVAAGAEDLAREMAAAMLDEIVAARRRGRDATLIVPVGPVDQFPALAAMVNERRVLCRDVAFINMDEYLGADGRWIDPRHPLSFRGFMERRFYACIDPDLAPIPENRVFPRPQAPDEISEIIERRGGVDACFGGIGINGHVAFNEPPEPGEEVSSERFRDLPARVLALSRETRTINAVTAGGEIAVVPERAVTVGMREILAARRLRFYCNRPWQAAVVRRVLHGPITPACPASFLRTHPDAAITVTDLVAERPQIALR